MPEEHRLLDRLRRHTNVTVTALVAVLCIIVGFATGFWLLFRLSYVILIAIPLAWFWTREMAKGLEVEVQRTDQRVTQGHPIEGRVWIRSRSLLPKVWLEIEDPSTLPGHAARRVLTLPVRGSASWSYRTRTRLRGVYQVGPVTVTVISASPLARMVTVPSSAGSATLSSLLLSV